MACDVGVYGMAVMGVNLALNIASRGFKVCVGNRTASRVDDALEFAKEQGLEENIVGVKDIKDFVEQIKKPRRIIMLVQAGAPVDLLISSLLPLLSQGDLLIDGGNEFYGKTEHRMELCGAKGIKYMGMGVSGGEEGARHGPSLMPGGTKESWELIKPVLVSIAAKINPKGSPPKFPNREYTEEEVRNACVAHVGPGGSGNFVKMVHNGIEYADMQLIAEVYSVLRHCYKMDNEQLANTFAEWNKTELESYLVEITAKILRKKDGDKYLLDLILDSAGSKGTGKWTVQQAAEWGVPVPCITAALDMRYISSYRALRERLSQIYAGSWPQEETGGCDAPKPTLDDMKSAMYLSKICCYAQGMHLIATVSKQKNWGIDLSEISRIWKGGCIIRAKFLDVMEAAFKTNPDVEQFLVIDSVRAAVAANMPGLRRILNFAVSKRSVAHEGGVAYLLSLPAMSSAYHYLAAFSSAWLPTNLIQAQRDFFGAHEFERRDQPGKKVHEANWTSSP